MMNNENVYSHGVNFYEFTDPLEQSPPAPFNTKLLLGNSNGLYASRNSPWENIRSGYSSTSPPGTASSASSTHSQCYGRSPDESVDSLITSLLHVVGSDSFGSPDDNKFSTTGNYSVPHTHDCNDSNCDTCLGIRPVNFPNSPHFIINKFSGAESSSAIKLPSASSKSSTSLYCDIHRDAQRYYCQTCSQTLCGECGTHHHHGHITVHVTEAVEGAGVQANQVLNEAKLGIASLKEDLDAVQLAAESLDHKARQATADVMLCISRVASALEAREKELLGKIEKARLLKFATLKARDEILRNGISRLSAAADKLSEAIESLTITGNPLDLLVRKDMASAEVFQIRKSHHNLPQPQENWISFTGPEGHVLQAISNLGSIIENNPGPIGDRRAVRGRGTSPQLIRMNQQQSQVIPVGSVARVRPIPANSFPVTVRISRDFLTSMPKTVCVIGNDGIQSDNLCRPWGIACDKEGHVIVADRSNNRIQIYRENGNFIRRFGAHGTEPGQFDRPAGVAVDDRRRIIVADKDNHRIQILTMEGIFLLSFGEKGSRCGQFNYPWDVAVNTECQIVVSDTRNHRIQLFSPEGIFLRKYGYETTPTMWKHFDSPRGVAFNADGNVVTTDFNNHRIIVIDADFMNAKVLGCDTGSANKPFLRPQGIVIDDDGNIIIADSRNHRIQVLDSTGNLKWKFGSYGRGNDEMDRPSGIALSPTGRIAVVDFGNNRVLMI